MSASPLRAFVLHEKHPTFGFESLRSEQPQEWLIAAMADFPSGTDHITAADKLFEHTNTIDASWFSIAGQIEDFTLTPGPSRRSTSVGDVVLFLENNNATCYRCASLGWEKIDALQSDQAIKAIAKHFAKTNITKAT